MKINEFQPEFTTEVTTEAIPTADTINETATGAYS
jgi:hypothetical protein